MIVEILLSNGVPMKWSINNEEQLQAACYQWFWNEPKYLTHRRMLFCVNNNSHNSIAGARAKAVGVTKGASDLVLVGYRQTHYIELKFGPGTQSAEQIDFESKVKKRGHPYYIVRTLNEFITLVQSIILY